VSDRAESRNDAGETRKAKLTETGEWKGTFASVLRWYFYTFNGLI
jgi:hypothetical protein